MKKITNKNFIQKTIIVILIVLSFNFVVPTFSHAGFGGILLDPVVTLLAAIPDAVIDGLQYFMLDGTWGEGLFSGYMIGKNTFWENQDDYPTAKYDSSRDANAIVKEVDTKDLDQSLLRSAIGDNGYEVPIVKYSPEKIFAGRIPALSVNFINPERYYENGAPTEKGKELIADGFTEEQIQKMEEKSIAGQLQKVISSWYNALRNLAIVGLLSVLLYVGIRMIISSATSEKAKYKQMIFDWLIAFCLLFFLHYIMAFTLTMNDVILQGLAGKDYNPIVVKVTETSQSVNTSQGATQGGSAGVVSNPQQNNQTTTQPTTDVIFKTDLLGLTRFYMQKSDLGEKLVYLILYIALVVYTCVFTWKYVKRSITIAFLTLMAPLVALTYPIDKIGDGKAQAFNKWLKEYIFNILLQPFHLILYTIFVGSAIEIAVNNPIYAILFLAFITPAEKILRSFFGFDKASTTGSTAIGAFGGAAAFNMMQKAIGASKGKGGKAQGGNKPLRTVTDPNEIGKDATAFTTGGELPAGDSSSGGGAPVRMANNSPANSPSIGGSSLIIGNQGGGNSPSGLVDIHGNPLTSTRGASSSGNGLPTSARDGVPTVGTQPRTSQTITSHNPGGTRTSNITGATNPSRASQALQSWDNFKDNHRVIRGVANLAEKPLKSGIEKARVRFTTPEGRKQTIKDAARLATRGLTTAGIGLAGLGMGIAGDELEDVFKYGAAGTVLGATVAGDKATSLGGRAASAISNTYLEGATGNEYAGQLQSQHDEVFLDKDRRAYFSEEFDVKGKDLDNVMTRVADCYNQDITDNKQIKQTLKLEDALRRETNTEGMTQEQVDDAYDLAKAQSMTIAKLADRYSDEKLRTDPKYVEGVYKDFRNSLKAVNPNMGESELKSGSEQMMRLLKKYKKID